MQFKEVQKFKQWWLWLFLGVVTAAVLTGSLYTVLHDGNTLGYIGIAFTIVPVIIMFLFRSMRLETMIDDTGVYYKYAPIHRGMQKVELKNIREAGIRKYKPISEFGGWGLRTGKNGSEAFNVSGNTGLELTFKNGKKLVLGTRKPAEMRAVLERIFAPGQAHHNILFTAD